MAVELLIADIKSTVESEQTGELFEAVTLVIEVGSVIVTEIGVVQLLSSLTVTI